MKQPRLYVRLCPGALALAFGVLALFAALAMGMPGTFGMGSMMGVGGFGLVTIVWTVAVGALGGAITAWTYNAIAGEQIAETSDLLRQPGISRPVRAIGMRAVR